MTHRISSLTGHQLNDAAVRAMKDSSLCRLYTRDVKSLVWQIRDNSDEQDEFVYLTFVINPGFHILNVEIAKARIGADGRVSALGPCLTPNEVEQVHRVIKTCTGVSIDLLRELGI